MIRFLPGQHPLPYFKPLHFWLVVLTISGFSLITVGVALYLHQYRTQFYPGIYIDSVPVGGLTADQARSLLLSRAEIPEFQITAAVDDIKISSSSSELGIHKKIDRSIQNGISYAKEGWWPLRLKSIIMLQFDPVVLTSTWAFEPEAVSKLLHELESQVNQPSQDPAAVLKTSQVVTSLEIQPGDFGREIEFEKAVTSLIPTADLVDFVWRVPVASTGGQLTTDQVTVARKRAQALVGSQILVKTPDTTLRLNDQEVISLLALPTGFSKRMIQQKIDDWAKRVDRPAQDAVFKYDPQSLKVTAFAPHRDGLAIERTKTSSNLINSLEELESKASATTSGSVEVESEVVVDRTAPVTTLASTNDLGITERIGFGVSEYDHSIPNRIHNVALTSDRINLTIVKPGAEFSFNKTLGDVSAATGFRPAYVIKNGQTTLGDGGGVCQVSTTLFRSVLNAGLPVTKRKAHSYRVSYYELDSKPGVDATVYAGDVDLRFVNDTGHHILIYSQADSQNLDMQIEIYGTSDGRTTEIIDHKTWDARPAPAPVFIPDPTLAPGQKKQVDFAASGIRASFTNVVRDKNGEILRRDTYTSNYVPWSAKYLVGP